MGQGLSLTAIVESKRDETVKKFRRGETFAPDDNCINQREMARSNKATIWEQCVVAGEILRQEPFRFEEEVRCQLLYKLRSSPGHSPKNFRFRQRERSKLNVRSPRAPYNLRVHVNTCSSALSA